MSAYAESLAKRDLYHIIANPGVWPRESVCGAAIGYAEHEESDLATAARICPLCKAGKKRPPRPPKTTDFNPRKGHPAGFCLYCGNKLRKERRGAGLGDYGDGFFCGLRCGYAWAVGAARLGHRLVKKGA